MTRPGIQIDSTRAFARPVGDGALRIWTLLWAIICCLCWTSGVQASCGDYVLVGLQPLPNADHGEPAGNRDAGLNADVAGDRYSGQVLSGTMTNSTRRTGDNLPVRGRPCTGPECRQRAPAAPVPLVEMEPDARESAVLFCLDDSTNVSSFLVLCEPPGSLARGNKDRIERPPRLA